MYWVAVLTWPDGTRDAIKCSGETADDVARRMRDQYAPHAVEVRGPAKTEDRGGWALYERILARVATEKKGDKDHEPPKKRDRHLH